MPSGSVGSTVSFGSVASMLSGYGVGGFFTHFFFFFGNVAPAMDEMTKMIAMVARKEVFMFG